MAAVMESGNLDDRGRVLAVIIGRAGSKGLPGKNSMPLPFGEKGRPVVCYSIDDARAANEVSRVVVSTDGDDIAQVAESAGVEVIRRPLELASDTATVDSAVRHAVTASGDSADIIVILYANVPIRPKRLIDRAVEMLRETNADSVQSYVPVGKCHPYWMVQADKERRITANVPNTIYRRQDLPPLYLPDGGVIAVTRKSLFAIEQSQPHAFLGTDRRAIITGPGAVVDIDSWLDAYVVTAIIMQGTGCQEATVEVG